MSGGGAVFGLRKLTRLFLKRGFFCRRCAGLNSDDTDDGRRVGDGANTRCRALSETTVVLDLCRNTPR